MAKRHIATDLDADLIVAAAITSANLAGDHCTAGRCGMTSSISTSRLCELFIDRGYIASDFVEHIIANHGEVICCPWQFSNRSVCSRRRTSRSTSATGPSPAHRVRRSASRNSVPRLFRRSDVLQVPATSEVHHGHRPWASSPHRPGRGAPTTPSASHRDPQWSRPAARAGSCRATGSRTSPVARGRALAIAAYARTRSTWCRAAALQNLEAVHRSSPK